MGGKELWLHGFMTTITRKSPAPIVGHKSLAEIDKGFAEGKQFETTMGEDGMKKLNEMFASCVSGTSTQLFAVDPKMSYVSDDWIKSDPDFWMPNQEKKK